MNLITNIVTCTIIMKPYYILLGSLMLFVACGRQRQTSQPVIDLSVVYHSTDTLFLQARSAVYPNNERQEVLMTTSIYGTGTHAYGDVYMLRKADGKWTVPTPVDSLRRHVLPNGLVRVIGDLTPAWHTASGKVLCTGKSFFAHAADTIGVADNRRVDIEELQEVSYAVYDPASESWSGMRVVEFPAKLDNGDDFRCVNAGCTQRADLPGGDILLPVRYLKGRNYVSTVVLCDFDGKTLRYKRHGTTFTVGRHRGLYEPSLCAYEGMYYLTLRGDTTAYVARSRDGLVYEPMKEWRFDDGALLGSYNTQQHWISNSHGLYLVYTRRGADNDHIFRHRAPLFVAEVDPVTLAVRRSTEQVLVPILDSNGDLGNFGVTYVSDNEAWVTVASLPSQSRETEIFLAKLVWK